MIRRSILLAGAAALLGASPAGAQTITENINNTGIPRNAPSLGLSSIYGLNPCSAGASVGLTTPLFGIGGAIASIDKECEVRNNAAIVITGLKDETLAREILCEIKDIRDAAVRVGKPCLQDGGAPRVASAEPVNPVGKGAYAAPQKTSEPIKPVSAAMPVVASNVVRADAPVFCRVTGLDVTLYPECTTAQAQVAPQAPVWKRPVSSVSQKAPSTAQREAAPVPAEKNAPDATAERLLRNPSWAEAVSYRSASITEEKPQRMIQRAVAIAPASIPAASPDPSARLTKLLDRGAAMAASGDIVAARLFYQRAAEAGSCQAAVEMGKTYDPVFLARISAVGIQADTSTADHWYRRAVALGDAKAASLLQVASR